MSSRPAYVRLADELRTKLRKESVQPGSFFGTEVELSKKHSLARMTVRRAVQILVNEGLVERRPGIGVFSRDISRLTRTMKMLAGNLCWVPAIRISRSAQKTAREFGIELILCDAHGCVEDDIEAIKNLPDNEVGGAILMSLHSPAFNEALCHLISAKFPFVVVDQNLREITAPSVCSDNLSGGMLAARALIRAGHKKIAFIGDLNASTTMDRLNGAIVAIEKMDAKLIARLDVGTDDRYGDWEPDIKFSITELLESANRPTALICSCDTVARSSYRAITELGLRIPEDISVIGFDDDPMAEWLDPPLSTIQQPFDEIGRVAMNLLIERVANYGKPCNNVLLPVTYIERESVAPPPAGKKMPVQRTATISAATAP